MHPKHNVNSAFTLIELIGVIIIISILTAMTIGATHMIDTSRITNARSATIDGPVSKVNDLVAWYETSLLDSFSSDEQYNNASITKWHDISQSSRNKLRNTLVRSATQAVTYIKKGINNIPSLKFSGQSGGNIKIPALYQGNLSTATIFFVISVNQHNTPTFFDSYSSATLLSYDPDQLYMRLSSNGVWTQNSSNLPEIKINKPVIIAAYFNSSKSKFYVNDALNIAGGSTINPGSNQISGIVIGSRNDNAYYYNGLISEIIIYNTQIKKSERQAIMAYLANKYSINVKNIHD